MGKVLNNVKISQHRSLRHFHAARQSERNALQGQIRALEARLSELEIRSNAHSSKLNAVSTKLDTVYRTASHNFQIYSKRWARGREALNVMHGLVRHVATAQVQHFSALLVDGKLGKYMASILKDKFFANHKHYILEDTIPDLVEMD
jgi:predicted  nucleic acid-binding Zn-ribbon protein